MLWHLLGWAVVAAYVVGTPVLTYVLWVAGWRPWLLRPEMPVPREPPALEWVVADQDNPIPWV